ncbi:unnamed protein product, partial [Closterium sp. NIES-64]
TALSIVTHGGAMALVDRTTDSPLFELLLGLKNASTDATAATVVTAAATATPRVAVIGTTPFLQPLLPASSHDRASSVEKVSSATAAAAASASYGETETGGAASSCFDATAPRLPDDQSVGLLLRAETTDEFSPAIAGSLTAAPPPPGRPMAPPSLAPSVSARDACQSPPADSLTQQQQNAVAAAALIASVLHAANAASGRCERTPIASSNVAGQADCWQNEIPNRKLVSLPPEGGGDASLRKHLVLHTQRNSWENIPGAVSSGGSLSSSPSGRVASLTRLSSPADVSTSSLPAFLAVPGPTKAAERSCYSESLAMALRAANEVTRINIGGREDMSSGELVDGFGFGQQERSSQSKRCPQCGRIFLSGQALGGHMRKHWKGPKRPEHSPRHAKDSLGVTKSAGAQGGKHGQKSPVRGQLKLTGRYSKESMEERKQVEAQEIDLDLRL